MRNKICYYSANVALISAVPCVLFLMLIGVDMVFKIGTFWGFIFVMVGAGYIMTCGVSMAVHIKHAFIDA